MLASAAQSMPWIGAGESDCGAGEPAIRNSNDDKGSEAAAAGSTTSGIRRGVDPAGAEPGSGIRAAIVGAVTGRGTSARKGGGGMTKA